MFHVFFNKLLPIITDKFNIWYCNYMYTCQHKVNFDVSWCKLQKRQFFIVHNGPYLWNDLPLGLKLVKNLQTFKQCIESYIFSVHNDNKY